MYRGEQQVFDTTQLTAMYLTQLKHTAENFLQNPLSGCVISV